MSTEGQTEEKKAKPADLGRLLKFMPLPPMPRHAQWFEAGAICFAVEARVLTNEDKSSITERSASIHVFSADRSQEYVRFDCFETFPHYHYILNADQHNISWGYDVVANGPMLPWALMTLRTRLPDMLRRAGEPALAARLESEGFDLAALDRVEAAIDAFEPAASPEELAREATAWYRRWKEIHPQFNTAA